MTCENASLAYTLVDIRRPDDYCNMAQSKSQASLTR